MLSTKDWRCHSLPEAGLRYYYQSQIRRDVLPTRPGNADLDQEERHSWQTELYKPSFKWGWNLAYQSVDWLSHTDNDTDLHGTVRLLLDHIIIFHLQLENSLAQVRRSPWACLSAYYPWIGSDLLIKIRGSDLHYPINIHIQAPSSVVKKIEPAI